MSFLSVNIYSTASNVSFVNAISISLVCVPSGLLWCYKAVSLHFTKTMLWFFIPDDFLIERKVHFLDFILYAQAVSSDGDCFFIMNDSLCTKKLETGRRREHSVLLLLLYQGAGAAAAAVITAAAAAMITATAAAILILRWSWNTRDLHC